MATHYEVLGIPDSATEFEILAAYRRKARPLNLDRFQGSRPVELGKAVRALAELDQALRVLGDPETRKAYDATLDIGRHPDAPDQDAGPGFPGSSPAPANDG
jgi:curved DNA-binding protein CbpA